MYVTYTLLLKIILIIKITVITVLTALTGSGSVLFPSREGWRASDGVCPLCIRDWVALDPVRRVQRRFRCEGRTGWRARTCARRAAAGPFARLRETPAGPPLVAASGRVG